MPTVQAVLQEGISSHLAGDLGAAAQCYASVLQADPAMADAWHLAGLVAHQCGRSADGRQYIEQAIELNPHDAEYYANLTAVLRALNDPKAALSAADCAVRIDPKLSAAWHQRGSALLDLDRIQEAIASFQRAYDTGFSPAAVWRETGLALQYAGDIDGSVGHLEKSLRINPQQPSVYFHLANLVRTHNYTFNAEQRSLMQGMIELNQVESNALGRLHAALAIDHEIQGAYSRAFQHFIEANRCYCAYLQHKKKIIFDRDALGRIVDQQINLFDQGAFETCDNSDLTDLCPIFIIGMPRSGTTLVAQILSQHAEIATAGELTAIGNMVNSRAASCAQQTVAEQLDANWLRTAGEVYLSELEAIAPNMAFVVDKMPENYKYLGYIAKMFPGAKIVHCRRDPRDVCLSAFCQLFQSDRLQMETASLEHLGQNYQQYRRLMRFWDRVIPIEIHEVFYEQLLDDPQREVRTLLDYIGLPWSDDCLSFHQRTSNVRTASSLQVRKPLHRNSIGKWKRYEPHLAELFQALGDSVQEFETAVGLVREVSTDSR